jgi:RNA polymerase sigma-70 factor (ECF subfamily)
MPFSDPSNTRKRALIAHAASDEVLMAAYVAGDEAAFDALFMRHAPVIRGLLRRHLRNDVEAGELVQQTFLLLHRARRDYRPGWALRPWLFTIAMNALREHVRRKNRRRESELTEALESKLAASDLPLASAEESLRAREQLRWALGRLPHAQREVIELHWFRGLPFHQIAPLVDASLSAVKVRAHRGYVRLRALLRPSGRPHRIATRAA